MPSKNHWEFCKTSMDRKKFEIYLSSGLVISAFTCSQKTLLADVLASTNVWQSEDKHEQVYSTCIFTCTTAKFTCPGQSDLGFSCPTGFHMPSYYNKALHVIILDRIRLGYCLCLIIFRLLMDVFNLQSCKSSSEWSNHEESVSASWGSHPISAAGDWLPWIMIYQPDMLTHSYKPIYMILFAGLIFCFIWFA